MAGTAAKRSKAAKKGAKTREANRLWLRRWHSIDEPAEARMLLLANELLKAGSFDLRLYPTAGQRQIRLKGGVTTGRLVKFLPFRTVRVLPKGYSRPQDYHWSHWMPIL